MKKKELKRQLKVMKKKYKKLRRNIADHYCITDYDMDCIEKYGVTADIWDYKDATNPKLIEQSFITEDDLPF